MSDLPILVPLRSIDARHEQKDWSFATERAEEIANFWAGFVTEKPASYNGRVLLQHRWSLDDGIYRCDYLETDYAAFLAWRAFDRPEPAMRNGFAMAALQASDGAFLLGEMGAHTANPGKIYFAAGTPDRGDLRADGTVDLAGSVLRELEEETGLRPEEVTVEPGWSAVIGAHSVAFMRKVRFDQPALAARAEMIARIAQQEAPELSDIHIIRTRADIDPARMPDFMGVYLTAILPA